MLKALRMTFLMGSVVLQAPTLYDSKGAALSPIGCMAAMNKKSFKDLPEDSWKKAFFMGLFFPGNVLRYTLQEANITISDEGMSFRWTKLNRTMAEAIYNDGVSLAISGPSKKSAGWWRRLGDAKVQEIVGGCHMIIIAGSVVTLLMRRAHVVLLMGYAAMVLLAYQSKETTSPFTLSPLVVVNVVLALIDMMSSYKDLGTEFKKKQDERTKSSKAASKADGKEKAS